MTRILSSFLLASLLSAATDTSARAASKTGEAKFTGPKRETVRVALGDQLQLTAEFKMIEVGQLAAISVPAKIKNPTKNRMHYSYNVAFLDKDKNLIGCQNFQLAAEPGRESTAGTFIQLPRDQIAKIAFYSVALHESEQQIGVK
jgi:hypothetical protein